MGSQLLRDISPINFTNQDLTIDNTKAPTRTTKKKIVTITNQEEESSKIESEVISIQMKHICLCEDKELIDNCIIKHFFRRTLGKTPRLEIIKEM